jgi:hypothetical protein
VGQSVRSCNDLLGRDGHSSGTLGHGLNCSILRGLRAANWIPAGRSLIARCGPLSVSANSVLANAHDFFSPRRAGFGDAGKTDSAPIFAKAKIVADRVTGAPGQM